MASQARTAEFDAFGPWILQVSTYDDVPPLFRTVANLDGANLALKIPRRIDRRDANPDLYDQLLIVRDQGMDVLTRTPQFAPGWRRLWVDWRELSAIQNSRSF